MPIETPARPQVAEELLPLREGERLNSAEFERRYAAFEVPRKAELIEGVVYVASPVSNLHSEPHSWLMGWLSFYRWHTQGVAMGDNGTVRMGEQDQPQPDVFLRISQGGNSHISADNYIVGAPELIGEISVSTQALDRGSRRRAYQAAGVREYVLWNVPGEVLEWFVLRNGVYEALSPGSDGILRSEVFPGLWLDASALLRDDTAALLKALQSGLATPEHAEFVRRLAADSGR